MKDGCPFCDYAGPSPILHDFGDAFVIEPINPVTPGHVLVVPRRHVEHAAILPGVTGRMFAWAARYVRDRAEEAAIQTGQEGWDNQVDALIGSWNILTSVGAEATQSVMHLHVHVVPRHDPDGLCLPWWCVSSQGAWRS